MVMFFGVVLWLVMFFSHAQPSCLSCEGRHNSLEGLWLTDTFYRICQVGCGDPIVSSQIIFPPDEGTTRGMRVPFTSVLTLDYCSSIRCLTWLSFAACSILDSVVSIFPSYELRVTSSRVTSFFPTILPTTRYGFTLLRSKERYSMRAFVIQELAS